MPETDTTELIREARALSADHDLEPALEKFRSAQRAGDDAPDVHFDIGSVLTDLSATGRLGSGTAMPWPR